MVRFFTLLLLSFIGLQQCKTATVQAGNEKPIFTLFRTACFGTCPSYTIEVYAKKVVYNGLVHTTPLGKQEAVIAAAEQKALKKKYETLALDTCKEFYPVGVPVPQDIPSVILTINISGKEKKIEMKGGNAPAAVKEWIAELEKLKTPFLSKSNTPEGQ